MILADGVKYSVSASYPRDTWDSTLKDRFYMELDQL